MQTATINSSVGAPEHPLEAMEIQCLISTASIRYIYYLAVQRIKTIYSRNKSTDNV